jgi:hypothetical protein
MVIGPFDGPKESGFDAAYPPESSVDLAAEHDGKAGKIRWKELTTADPYGTVNLNDALGKHKGSVAFAVADFTSDRAREVELRLGCVTAWKLWVDGKLLFAHEEWHHGIEMDQFRVKAELRPGPNRILLKVCQNEQTEDWAQEWRFQLRICDASGTAVPSTASPEGTRKEAKL